MSTHPREPEVCAELRRYVLEELLRGEIPDVGDEQRLVSGGLIDSLLLVRIAAHIEERFDVRLPDEALTDEPFDSLRDMTVAVVHRLP